MSQALIWSTKQQAKSQGNESKCPQSIHHDRHLNKEPTDRIESLLLFGSIKLFDGRYWIRTSDPFRVKEVRYRCANRPVRNVRTDPLEPIGNIGNLTDPGIAENPQNPQGLGGKGPKGLLAEPVLRPAKHKPRPPR